MMARLVPCPSCGSLVRHGDTKCPSCEASIGDRTVVVRAAGAMLVLGLTLTGCPASDDSGETVGDESSETVPTVSTTNGDTGSSSATEGDEVTSAATTGPLYGTFATGSEDGSTASTTDGESGSSSDSGSGSDTDTDTDGTTGPSPLYGVAET
jgi:hypothetical protein